jgi:hypothetical protein
MPLADCFRLLAVAALPLVILEIAKTVRNSKWQRKPDLTARFS